MASEELYEELLDRVAAVEKRLEAKPGGIDAATRTELDQIRNELDDLRKDVDLNTVTIDQLLNGAQAPDAVRGPWDWAVYDYDQAKTAWAKLSHWLEEEFLPMWDKDMHSVKPCWFAHPLVVQRLGDLWYLNRDARYGSKLATTVYSYSHRDAQGTVDQCAKDLGDCGVSCEELGDSVPSTQELRENPDLREQVRQQFIDLDLAGRKNGPTGSV